MLFPESVVKVYKKTACNLKGSAKRIFMAEVVKAYGLGAQREAEAKLKWCRNTIKKGSHEMKSGIVCIDNFKGRGRKKAEEKKLLEQIRQIVENESQADPAMNSERMYIRMTANAVREELKTRFG